MVTIVEVTTFQRRDGIIESEAVVTAADGDSVTSGELGLGTISKIKSVQPLKDGNVAGAAVITNPSAINNSVALTLYTLQTDGTLASAASADWFINAQQV